MHNRFERRRWHSRFEAKVGLFSAPFTYKVDLLQAQAECIVEAILTPFLSHSKLVLKPE